MYEMRIRRQGEADPALKEINAESIMNMPPVVGKWYSGMSERGRGAVAQYQGWGEFTLGDGTLVDMTHYDYIEESTVTHRE